MIFTWNRNFRKVSYFKLALFFVQDKENVDGNETDTWNDSQTTSEKVPNRVSLLLFSFLSVLSSWYSYHRNRPITSTLFILDRVNLFFDVSTLKCKQEYFT